jgi:hypothetical protein
LFSEELTSTLALYLEVEIPRQAVFRIDGRDVHGDSGDKPIATTFSGNAGWRINLRDHFVEGLPSLPCSASPMPTKLLHEEDCKVFVSVVVVACSCWSLQLLYRLITVTLT